MQRGECAVLHTSVKHRSYRVQKSDLCGLRTAEILFLLSVICILSQGSCIVLQVFTEVFYYFCHAKCKVGPYMQRLDQEKKEFLRCCQCFLSQFGVPLTRTRHRIAM